MLTSAVLAGMMVVGVLWNQQTRAATFADSLVAEMSDLWSGRGHLDIESADPDRVVEWAHRTLGWDVQLAGNAQKDHRQLGAVTHWVNGSRAVFVLYDVAGHPASVVIVPTAEADLRQMRPPADDGDCYHDRCRGYTVMAMRRGVLTYAAIGQLPEHELATLIDGRIAAR